ncbi:hypothetical protein CMV_007925 [Castanea mollissima]|uniref:Uncharacterized protein n=1 Tax=Castanea mollissima TaxID=60419 RepID=A0A8J4RTT4_9ROSI|nr:hypothetical protein CMV_007925 [Castanea mollissima]
MDVLRSGLFEVGCNYGIQTLLGRVFTRFVVLKAFFFGVWLSVSARDEVLRWLMSVLPCMHCEDVTCNLHTT